MYHNCTKSYLSRPVWGAWIEIRLPLVLPWLLLGRAPYGARGLKWLLPFDPNIYDGSRPVWGAWIEIDQEITDAGYLTESRPVWGAWIEIVIVSGVDWMQSMSRPVWGAWIEIRLR